MFVEIKLSIEELDIILSSLNFYYSLDEEMENKADKLFDKLALIRTDLINEKLQIIKIEEEQ